jgi:hypothetical protein
MCLMSSITVTILAISLAHSNNYPELSNLPYVR